MKNLDACVELASDPLHDAMVDESVDEARGDAHELVDPLLRRVLEERRRGLEQDAQPALVKAVGD